MVGIRRVGEPFRFILFGLLVALAIGWIWNQPVKAQAGSQHSAVIYYFWGEGCPHCAKAKPFLAELQQRYPGLEIRAYEVRNNKDNLALLVKMAEAEGFKPTATPTFFIGDTYLVGFSDEIAVQLEDLVKTCSASGCKDPGVGIFPGLTEQQTGVVSAAEQTRLNPIADELNVPLIGKVSLHSQSLVVSTLLISFVDGVNPCSVWVLTMLLALTLHTGSRRKVVLIGLIFLTVTAAVYALFIAGLFTMLTFASFVGWIQVIVALMALFFGLVNVKDYFWYKEGLSFTIADEKKPGIYKNIRKIMDASQSFWGLAGATVVMAAGVSLVEFTCTAGFPVLWTNLLVSQKVGALTFILLLLLYMLIYQLDEMAIFFTAVFSMKASKLEEKHGRILKLVGGVLMLVLAAVMLINPALMNSLSSSIIIFGVATALVLLILLVHRRILPAFGIWIGTEAEGDRKVKPMTPKI